MFQEQFTKAQRRLIELKKDNDLIYHDMVPDVEKLEPLGKIPLANPLPVPQKWNDKFTGEQECYIFIIFINY